MPSLYESTVNTGEVSSSNFTTLYNASGLAVPDAGAGSVTGNLNVGGNLTVQGSSLFVGPVQLQDSLCLPNYCFPVPDGTTDQVLYTDGSGNVNWTNVQALPGANYNITASSTTGGANLNLVSGITTDTVKFAGSARITVSQTDASTITISTDADNIPDGTANGQVLVWEGGAWTANNNIVSNTAADRLVAIYANSTVGVNNAIFARKDYLASTYTTGSGTGIGFQLASNSQTTNQITNIIAAWDPVAPVIALSTNINNNTTGPFVSAATFSTLQATLPGDLAVNGGDITTTSTSGQLFNTNATTVNIGNAATTEVNLGNISTGRVYIKSPLLETSNNIIAAGDVAVNGGDLTTISATGNLFNANAVVVNIGNGATTEVNLGNTSAGRVQIKPNTIVGANTTQNVFNTVATTANAFGAATAVNIGAATGVTTVNHDLTVQGGNINLNGVATAGVQPFLTFATQPDGVNSLYGIRGKSALTDPWFIGSGSAGPDLGYIEIATGDNAGTPGNGGEIYVRQYNGAGGINVPWEGGTGTVVNQVTLLDSDGNTSIQNNLSVGINISQSGETLYLNYDKTNANVNIDFGRVAPSTNAVIRWNSTTNTFEWSENGSTWHQFIDATLTAPFYNGQMLTYRINSSAVGEWINDNRVVTTDVNERNVFEYRPLTPPAGFNTSLYLRKNYSNSVEGTPGSGTYADGAGVGVSFQVNSDTQAPPGGVAGQANQYASVAGIYSATVPEIQLKTSIDNFASSTNVATFNTTLATLPGDLAVNGGDITTTSGTGNLFNANATVVNVGNGATTEVNLGSISAGRVQIKPNTIVGANTTQNVFNTVATTVNAFGAATTVNIGAATGNTTINNDLSVDGFIDINNVSTLNTQQTTTIVTTPVIISGSTRTAQKVVITIKDLATGEQHVVEALALRKQGTTQAYLTTYGEMYTNTALATFTATATTTGPTAGTINILATPASTNSTLFTVTRVSVE